MCRTAKERDLTQQRSKSCWAVASLSEDVAALQEKLSREGGLTNRGQEGGPASSRSATAWEFQKEEELRPRLQDAHEKALRGGRGLQQASQKQSAPWSSLDEEDEKLQAEGDRTATGHRVSGDAETALPWACSARLPTCLGLPCLGRRTGPRGGPKISSQQRREHSEA